MIGARALRRKRSTGYSAEYPYAPCTSIASCAALNAASVAYCVPRTNAEPVFDRLGAQGIATRFAVEHEGRYAAAAGFRIGLREHEHVVGRVRIRHPDLLPVQDVSVAAAARGGLHRGDIRAGVRFGQAVARKLLAGGHGHEPPLLLVLGGPCVETHPYQADMHREDGPVDGVDVLELFTHDTQRQVSETAAAVALREPTSWP